MSRTMPITASEARKNLFGLIEQVNDDQAAVEITSRKGDAVLISAGEYRALEETAHLLRSAENVLRLAESRQAVAEGRTIKLDFERDLA